LLNIRDRLKPSLHFNGRGSAFVKGMEVRKNQFVICERMGILNGLMSKRPESARATARIVLLTVGILLVTLALVIRGYHDVAKPTNQRDEPVNLNSHQPKISKINAPNHQPLFPSSNNRRSVTETSFALPTVNTNLTLPTIGTGITGPAIFYALADIPYNQTQVEMLRSQILNIPEDAEFVVHLGDLRNAYDYPTCLRSDYTSVASILRSSRVPVFVIRKYISFE
jgi:hypothetical protein